MQKIIAGGGWQLLLWILLIAVVIGFVIGISTLCIGRKKKKHHFKEGRYKGAGEKFDDIISKKGIRDDDILALLENDMEFHANKKFKS